MHDADLPDVHLVRSYPPNVRRYPLSDVGRQELFDRFSYHPPKNDQAERYSMLREQMLAIATTISTLVPPGRERATALTHLDAAMMFANAGIARGEAEPSLPPIARRPPERAGGEDQNQPDAPYDPRDSVAGD